MLVRQRALGLLILGFVIAGCGASGATLERSSDGDGWWILDEDGFSLQDASVPTAALAGQRWALEYSSGRHTLEIVAFDETSGMTSLVESQSVVVGEATVDGTKMTLRQFAGLPSKDIPPSVGAVWLEGSLLIQFGGSGLDESELRAHLQHLQHVDRDRFQADVHAAQQRNQNLPKPAPTTSLPVDSTPGAKRDRLSAEQTQAAVEITANDPSVAAITKDHPATYRVLGPTTYVPAHQITGAAVEVRFNSAIELVDTPLPQHGGLPPGSDRVEVPTAPYTATGVMSLTVFVDLGRKQVLTVKPGVGSQVVSQHPQDQPSQD